MGARHETAIALHSMRYNFCRIHATLRVTPAMEADWPGRGRSIGLRMVTIPCSRLIISLKIGHTSPITYA